MTAWPSLNKNVWLRLPCCNAEHPSRVENTVGDDIFVSAPQAPHTQPVDPKTMRGGFFVGWTMERGALEVPVDLVAETVDNIPVWRLKPAGPPVETQRRRYVRVEVTCEVSLFLLEAGAPTRTLTTTLSEGGLSCALDKWALDPGTRSFALELEVDGEAFGLRGVMAWWGNLDSDDLRSVGVQFLGAPPATADRIRAFVFGRQLAARRSSA